MDDESVNADTGFNTPTMTVQFLQLRNANTCAGISTVIGRGASKDTYAGTSTVIGRGASKDTGTDTG